MRNLRKQKGFTQEDMILYGFSARHWQQVEAGRPITVTTLLRIGDVFKVTLASLVDGLDAPSFSDEKETLLIQETCPSSSKKPRKPKKPPVV